MAPVAAQRPVRLADAIREALDAGPTALFARSDSAAARASLLTARAFPNPVLVASYTKDAPQYHAEIEQPLDFLGPRGARIRAAAAALTAASRQLELERARIRYDVTIAYVHALAAARFLALSGRAADEADELAGMARARRDAGDASDLDVGVAELYAGERHNALLADSLAAVDALVELQLMLGQPGDVITISLSDSLETLDPGTPGTGPSLFVAAADAELRARQAELAFERRSRFQAPALLAGVETHEAGGANAGLPILGLSFPIPLLDRNTGPVQAARVAMDRASIALGVARRGNEAAQARASRDLSAAAARLERDRAQLATADRLAALVNTAYREGAYPLASVLEAQRGARDALRQFIEDAATLAVARAAQVLLAAGLESQ